MVNFDCTMRVGMVAECHHACLQISLRMTGFLVEGSNSFSSDRAGNSENIKKSAGPGIGWLGKKENRKREKNE